MLYKLLSSLAAFLLKVLFKIEVKGKEAMPHNHPFILISNHISNLDPIVIGAVCPYELCFLAKEELFGNKPFALLLKAIGVLPLKRGKSDIRMIRTCLEILKKKPLLLFPQGTRSDSYDKFMPGVGFLYKKTGLPVIAAKIYGTDKILPKGAKFLKAGKIKVIFDKVRDIKNTDSRQEVTLKVREKIKVL